MFVTLNFIIQQLKKMKNITYLIISFFTFTSTIKAQENTDLDLLKAPISPASNLLGFAQSEIDKPTDVSDFMLSLQSVTNSYTSLPSNYAVDIAPFWLLKNKTNLGDISTVGLEKSNGKNVIKQSLVVSMAIKNPDSTANGFNTNSTYAGLGFKFSIYRGNYDKKTIENLKHIAELQKIRLELVDKKVLAVYDNLPEEINKLKESRKEIYRNFDTNDESELNIKLGEILMQKEAEINSKIESKIEQLFNNQDSSDKFKTLDSKIKKLASEFQLARVGFSWEVSGGVSNEFRQKDFNNSKIYNAGLWTTMGYTWEKSGAILGIIRYLYNPDKVFALDNTANVIENSSTFDAGLRYIVGDSQSKFNGSLEAIYRSVPSNIDVIDSSWRLMLNLDYSILKNQKLTFSFGRNYDGTTIKNNNLIATIGTVFGFGNKR